MRHRLLPLAALLAAGTFVPTPARAQERSDELRRIFEQVEELAGRIEALHDAIAALGGGGWTDPESRLAGYAEHEFDMFVLLSRIGVVAN